MAGLRPIEDVICGLDEAVMSVVSELEVADEDLVVFRFVIASCCRRHGVVLQRLDEGDSPLWLYVDGVTARWADDGPTGDGMAPVAEAALDEAGDGRWAAAAVAGRVAIFLADQPELGDDDLAVAALADWCDTIVFVEAMAEQ